MNEVDEYIAKTIKAGDEGSKLLAARCAQTLKNNKYINVINPGMNGIAVIDNIPEDKLILVNSCGGSTKWKGSIHAKSLVDNLVKGARAMGATPVAMSDIVDANGIDKGYLEYVAEGLVQGADDQEIAIINGELADLGSRVNCQANISGTLVSLIDREKVHLESHDRHTFSFGNVQYAAFDPKGKCVFMNSDGIGTKTEFYERSGRYELGVNDFIAMNTDDAIKIGAEVKVVSGVLEMKGEIPFRNIMTYTRKIAEKMGIMGIMQPEEVGDRIRGYKEESPSYNISGSTVSTIDKKALSNLPKPSEDEYLIAIRGNPNPRSNGISAKRKVMAKLFGENWHETEAGKLFLSYLAEPSTILYPVFRELHQGGLATSFYHLSGGAYKGKLAKPLAKHGLFVEMNDLFNPDWREVTLAAHSLSVRDSYEKWPMGSDGFVTAPFEAIMSVHEKINSFGLESRLVGKLLKDPAGRTGVELTAYNGEKVSFSGLY